MWEHVCVRITKRFSSSPFCHLRVNGASPLLIRPLLCWELGDASRLCELIKNNDNGVKSPAPAIATKQKGEGSLERKSN